MIDISKLSSCYEIRRMDDSDTDAILDLCKKNTQYYRYCEASATRKQVLNDLHITPLGIDLKDKYYIGFYRNETLVAVMDLIDGYPDPDIVFIGFFMMNMAFQGQGIGSSIIQEVSSYLRASGKAAVRLAIDKGNPQSTHFWKKNGFVVIKEVDRNGWTALVAQRNL